MKRQQPMQCLQKFNCRLAILLLIHYFTFTFLAFIVIAEIRRFTMATSPRFRDVKNNFLHCSRVKGVTRGSTRFCAILNKLTLLKFHPVVSRDVKFPHHCKTIDVQRGDSDISISLINCSQNTSQPNIVKK